MSDTLVTIENVSKKFCRTLKRSLWYGVKDIGSELFLRSNGHRGLRKEEFWAIRDVSLELRRGETLGLIGANGAGKTTLLRMLNGLIKPDAGRIEVRGRMQALIALGAGFNPILTGRENIYVNAAVLGISKSQVDRRFDEIVDFSGIEEFIDMPVQSYSSGMAVRVGFAVAAHLSPDVLLVDEVLAVGDEGFQSKCLSKIAELKKSGTGIILVSHNMHTISTFAKNVVLLKNGKHKFFNNVSEGISEYRKRFALNDRVEIQRIHSGNDNINFFQVSVNKQEFYPGESFNISMKYEAKIDFFDAEIDLTLKSDNDNSLYFQATNRAYNKTVDLPKGRHDLRIGIRDIPVQNAEAIIGIGIWAKNRTEHLFWWRIPLKFKGVSHSTGMNHLNVSYHG
ncbi:MAG TPA: ABC transporter ATP-binding protein [Thermodesulfobacteriota bacterium]